MGANAAAAANGLHEHRERDLAVGKRSLELIPIMERERRADALFTAILEQLVLVEAVHCALLGGAQGNYPDFLEPVGVGGKYFDFRVNKRCYGLDAVFLTDAQNLVYVAGSGYARHDILAVAKLKGRRGRLMVRANKQASFAYGFLDIAQQAAAAANAAK